MSPQGSDKLLKKKTSPVLIFDFFRLLKSSQVRVPTEVIIVG